MNNFPASRSCLLLALVALVLLTNSLFAYPHGDISRPREAVPRSESRRTLYARARRLKFKGENVEVEDKKLTAGNSAASVFRTTEEYDGHPAILKIYPLAEISGSGELVEKEFEYCKRAKIGIADDAQVKKGKAFYMMMLKDVRTAFKDQNDKDGKKIGILKPFHEWVAADPDMEAKLPEFVKLVKEYLEETAEKEGLLYKDANFDQFFTNEALSFVIAIDWAPEDMKGQGLHGVQDVDDLDEDDDQLVQAFKNDLDDKDENFHRELSESRLKARVLKFKEDDNK